MDPYDEEAAAKYMMDAINEDTRVNVTEQFSAEEARTADSFLIMSGDGSDGDNDFTPTPAQQPILVRILIMHGDLTILDLRLIYLLLHLAVLCIEVERETLSNQKTLGKTGRHRSGHRGLSKCSRGC